MRQNLSGILFITICFLFTQTWGLNQDKKEKIVINAKTTIYNYKTGVNIFEGHVHVQQGTTHLKADKVITKNNNKHEIKEAIAYGLQNPAHYWTTPKIDKPEIHAHANIIKFYPIDSNIILEEQVELTQAKNNFRGQMILYNMQTQIITVPPSAKGYARLVYHKDAS